MRDSMKLVAEAITRLAVLEERHANTAETIKRHDVAIGALEERERATELKQAANIGKEAGANHTMKVVWSIVGGVVTFIATQIFTSLFAAHGVTATPPH